MPLLFTAATGLLVLGSIILGSPQSLDALELGADLHSPAGVVDARWQDHASSDMPPGVAPQPSFASRFASAAASEPKCPLYDLYGRSREFALLSRGVRLGDRGRVVRVALHCVGAWSSARDGWGEVRVARASVLLAICEGRWGGGGVGGDGCWAAGNNDL